MGHENIQKQKRMNQTLPPLPVPQGTPLPSREMVTNQQFQTVLDILGSLQPYLLLTQREIESGIPKELDGGVNSAAATTFIKACDRLDTMLDDMSRWKLETNDALYEAMTAHFQGATKAHEGQMKVFEDMQRPSRKLRPSLTTINFEFIAYWGDVTLPGGMILGRGKTPSEALLDFDNAFNRAAAEQLRFAPASEERLRAAATPHPVENKKKRKRKSSY